MHIMHVTAGADTLHTSHGKSSCAFFLTSIDKFQARENLFGFDATKDVDMRKTLSIKLLGLLSDSSGGFSVEQGKFRIRLELGINRSSIDGLGNLRLLNRALDGGNLKLLLLGIEDRLDEVGGLAREDGGINDIGNLRGIDNKDLRLEVE
ncbi:hypothetical protein HG530_011264 [Fusarium avenaceum]|nr:hypothetical protein HG530_011264 [Fusarium avenaceum]